LRNAVALHGLMRNGLRSVVMVEYRAKQYGVYAHISQGRDQASR
jgi:hypothetical protein